MIDLELAEIRHCIERAAESRSALARDVAEELDLRSEVIERLKRAAEWLESVGFLPDAA